MGSLLQVYIFGFGPGALWLLIPLWFVLGDGDFFSSTPPPLPRFTMAHTLGQGTEWRFNPLVVDINGDGYLDLAATARLVDPALHIWLGDGKTFTPAKRTWTDIGYAALATGDVNHDGFPDIVGVSHFGGVQTLLSDGQGGFTETIMRREDGYVAAQLADINGHGELDLIALGFEKVGIEIYLGDGKGNWRLHTTLPKPPPGQTMPGRALVLGDLNHDGHLDVVAAFNRWGLYIYYGDGQGGFTGGLADFIPPRAFDSIGVSLALGDVNHDGHPDLVINGTACEPRPSRPVRERASHSELAINGTLCEGNKLNGPDVYLGDGCRGWTASSMGLKALRVAAPGLALGDLDGDGHLDILAGGNVTGELRSGYGLFWFRGDGKGGWQLVQESGLPPQGLSFPESIVLADLDRDGVPEIITLHGGSGNITIWKRQ